MGCSWYSHVGKKLIALPANDLKYCLIGSSSIYLFMSLSEYEHCKLKINNICLNCFGHPLWHAKVVYGP